MRHRRSGLLCSVLSVGPCCPPSPLVPGEGLHVFGALSPADDVVCDAWVVVYEHDLAHSAILFAVFTSGIGTPSSLAAAIRADPSKDPPVTTVRCPTRIAQVPCSSFQDFSSTTRCTLPAFFACRRSRGYCFRSELALRRLDCQKPFGSST